MGHHCNPVPGEIVFCQAFQQSCITWIIICNSYKKHFILSLKFFRLLVWHYITKKTE